MKHMKFWHLALAASSLLLCGSVAEAQTASPLTAAPASVSLTYQKPATAGAAVSVKISAAASTFFTVDTTTVPIWLTLGAANGTAVSTGTTISFTPSDLSATLASGSYSATVKLKVTNYGDLSIPVTIVVKNASPTLTVKEGLTQTLTWSPGAASPTLALTMVSSNEPISFTAAAAVTAPTSPANWMKLDHASGVAYAWGTPVNISFVPQVFAQANIGDALTGTITITPAGGTPIVVNLTINITPASATVSRIYPSETPVMASGSLTVVVTGNNFVASPSDKMTTVTLTVGNGSPVALDPTAVSVVNASTMVLTIPAAITTPSAVNVLTAAAAVVITLNNPGTVPTATATLNVTNSPVIYAITSSASFQQASPGSSPTFAPYELVSIFGDNFGPDAVTTLTGSLDSFSRYPAKLTTNSKDLVVTFYKSDGTTSIANAYLLFATKNQINCIVPSGIVGNTTAKVAVSFNSVASSQYTINVGTADPGVFTTDASGQGQGAILHSADYSVNSSTNKAAKGSTILIYLTGLGAPNSTAANTNSTTAPAYPAACISPTAYMGSINALSPAPTPAWTSIDGAIMLSSKLATNHFPPCVGAPTTVSVTIDGKAANVSYAGFVADSLTGLYQINAVVPTTATSGTAVPVQITVGTAKSQTGVTMAIQ